MKKVTFKIKSVFADFNLKRDKALIYSFISVIAGLIAGSIITFTDFKADVSALLVAFFTDFTDKSKAEIFCGLALEGLIFFMAIFIAGSNIFGKIIALILSALKASGVSAIVSVLYSQYGLKGLEYTLFVLMPGKFILFFSMLFMTKFCYEFSNDLRSVKGNPKETKSAANVFVVKSIMALFIMLFSWLVDFLCIIIFSGLFTFNTQ